MSNTFTQLQIHVVLSVKNREQLITKEIESEIFSYITGIVNNNGHRLLQINGMPDHIHILLSLNPKQSISELIKAIKPGSSFRINSSGWIKHKFNWQSGYAAFSCSRSHAERTIQYIRNQKEHHKKLPFMAEYKRFLDLNNIDYNEKFL